MGIYDRDYYRTPQRSMVHGSNAGGEAAHLGGGILGWVLIHHKWVLDFAAPKRVVRRRKVKDWSRDFNR